jgi:hypothetical protein
MVEVCSFVMMVFVTREGAAAATPDEAKGGSAESNLARMEKCIVSMTRDILKNLSLRGGDSVGLDIRAGDERSIFEGAISSALKGDSLIVFATPDSSSQYRMGVSAPAVRVRYTNMYRDGMFGAQKVRREIAAEMTATVTRGVSREVIYSGMVKHEMADSVKVDAVPSIENESVPASRATLPSEKGMDRFVEPFVIIGATAVAIFLLFHVRS